MADKVSWLPPFESSNLQDVGYNEDKHTLLAIFKNGNPYIYRDVPMEIFNALVDTATSDMSVGKAFNELVKGGGFKFEQLSPAGDPVPEKAQPVTHGVPLGMLWFDNNMGINIEARVNRAINYYIEKYGTPATQQYFVAVNPDEMPVKDDDHVEYFFSSKGTSYHESLIALVYADESIMPHHFLVSETRI